MDNKELQFKTNINCGGCIARVKPALDSTEGIASWSVDTENPEKILTISSNGISQEQVIDLIKSKGFKIESL